MPTWALHWRERRGRTDSVPWNRKPDWLVLSRMTVGGKDVGVRTVNWPSWVSGMSVLLLMRTFREILPERVKKRRKVVWKDCQRIWESKQSWWPESGRTWLFHGLRISQSRMPYKYEEHCSLSNWKLAGSLRRGWNRKCLRSTVVIFKSRQACGIDTHHQCHTAGSGMKLSGWTSPTAVALSADCISDLPGELYNYTSAWDSP